MCPHPNPSTEMINIYSTIFRLIRRRGAAGEPKQGGLHSPRPLCPAPPGLLTDIVSPACPGSSPGPPAPNTRPARCLGGIQIGRLSQFIWPFSTRRSSGFTPSSSQILRLSVHGPEASLIPRFLRWPCTCQRSARQPMISGGRQLVRVAASWRLVLPLTCSVSATSSVHCCRRRIKPLLHLSSKSEVQLQSWGQSFYSCQTFYC